MTCARRLLEEIGAAKVRLGLDAGDVHGPAGRIAGEGVEVARRLAGFVEGTGVAISGIVHDQIANRSYLSFDPPLLRDAAREGRPARIFRAQLGGVFERPSAETPPTEKPSIAVLAFVNMSGDSAQDYFSDGIAEDIIVELSRSRSLFVIARNSSFAYRGRAMDLRKIGSELAVDFILEGSVRKSGNRLRITAQLEDARSSRHLWSERYDREMTDIFAVQDDVTRRIVSAIVDRVEHVEVEQATRRRPENLDAYDCLLRSLPLLRGYTAAENEKARQWLEKAVALDPSYGQAHAHLAASDLFEWLLGADDAILARALERALKAVALDENDGEAHQTLARVLLFRGDHDGAARHFDRGLMLNPNDADLAANLGLFQAYVGRADEGLSSIERGMRFNPNHPDWYWEFLGIAALMAGHFERAIKAFQRLTAQPSWIPG
jgi:adenylate cyclase